MRCRIRLILPLLLLTVGLSGCASPNLEEQRRNAYRLYLEQEYAAAARGFEILVERIPRDAELWFRLGNAYTRSKQPKQAIAAYENAIMRDPRMTRAWYNKGIVHLQEGLKTFVDMPEYVDAADPVARQGAYKRAQLLEILAPTSTVD